MASILDERIEIPHVPLVLVLRVVDEGAVGGVVLNHPQVGEMLHDVAIAVDTPLLIRSANPIDTYLRRNVRSIVQRLCHILQTTPYQHVERTRVVSACLLHNPLRTFRRLAIAAGWQFVSTTLLHQPSQRLGLHQPSDVAAQSGQVLLIDINHAVYLTRASAAERRRRDQSFEVELVGIHQEVCHRLVVVGVCATDVSTD